MPLLEPAHLRSLNPTEVIWTRMRPPAAAVLVLLLQPKHSSTSPLRNGSRIPYPFWKILIQGHSLNDWKELSLNYYFVLLSDPIFDLFFCFHFRQQCLYSTLPHDTWI